MGVRRVKMFELDVEGDYVQTIKFVKKLKRRMKSNIQGETDKILWFENKSQKKDVFCYEFCLDVIDTLEIKSELLQKEVESCISEIRFKTAQVVKFKWVNNEVAHFKD